MKACLLYTSLPELVTEEAAASLEITEKDWQKNNEESKEEGFV